MTHALVFKVELLHLLIGHFLSFLKDAVEHRRLNRQAGLGGGAPDVVEHEVQTAQRLAGPIQTDLTKEPMLDGIPFRAAGGIMAHRHAQSIAIADLFLQVQLKTTSARAETLSGIGQDQQMRGLGEALPTLVFPPVGQSRDGKLRCIGGSAHVDRAAIVAHIIHPVGHRSRVSHRAESHAALPASASGPHARPAFLRVANQLFLRGIPTSDRPVGGFKDLPLPRDDLKLRLAIRVGAARLALFRIHPQAVTELA